MNKHVISELNIFPVKSLQGISLQASEVTEQGLKWDRHWMIVNEDGLFATQRHFAKMATITTELTDSHLILSHPDHEPCAIALTSNLENTLNKKQVKVWKSECIALDEGEVVSLWLTNVLGQWRGQNLSLVKMSPEFNRSVSTSHTNGANNTTLFSDGYPYLITTTASLSELNHQLQLQAEQPIPMSRFRANIVVDNISDETGAFIENRTRQLIHDESNITFDLCKPCERCNVPSIDQQLGTVLSKQQPLKTLFRMEHVKQKGAFFGHNAVLAESAKQLINQMGKLIINVGDTVNFD